MANINKIYKVYLPKQDGGDFVGNYDLKRMVSFAQSNWDDIKNDFPTEDLGKRPSNENEAVEFLISQGLYNVKNDN